MNLALVLTSFPQDHQIAIHCSWNLYSHYCSFIIVLMQNIFKFFAVMTGFSVCSVVEERVVVEIQRLIIVKIDDRAFQIRQDFRIQTNLV